MTPARQLPPWQSPRQRSCGLGYAAAEAVFVCPTVFALFLLPTGRPRFLASAIQAGGRPRRRPRPRANRSRLKIASSNCSRSWRNSSRIFETSISLLFSCSGIDSVVTASFHIWNIQSKSPKLQLRFLLDKHAQSKRYVPISERKQIIPYRNWHFRNTGHGARANKNKTVALIKSRQFRRLTGEALSRAY